MLRWLKHLLSSGAHRNGGKSTDNPTNTAGPDLPVSFGYKATWIAVRSEDPAAVARALGLKNVKVASWADGVERADRLRGVFVSPPVDGWVLALGKLPDADGEAFESFLADLSRHLGQVFFFATHRVVEYHAWAAADAGRITRAFAFIGDQGEFPLNIGDRLPKETELGVGEPDMESAPDEDHVLAIAAALTINPLELEQHEDAVGPGLFGTR